MSVYKTIFSEELSRTKDEKYFFEARHRALLGLESLEIGNWLLANKLSLSIGINKETKFDFHSLVAF